MAAAIAGATAATSAMVVGEIGTSFEELLLAAPALAALLVLTPRRGEAGFDAGRARVLAAGLLTGIAVGFKIALLPLAFGLTSGLVAISGRRDRAGVTLRLGAGLVLGFLLSGGVWGRCSGGASATRSSPF